MHIALASMFRNSTPYLDRYFDQVSRLHRVVRGQGHSFRVLWAEGDSADRTWERLQGMARAYVADCFQRAHGGPVYGSVDDAQRWRQISFVCNALLERVQPEDDALIYVESDLIWEPETMLALLEQLRELDAVAPMCFHREGFFYDTWGYRSGGVRFAPGAPHHPMLLELVPGPARRRYPLDSAGSCLVMRGAVARAARFDPPEQGIVGFGLDLHAKGYHLWLDPCQKVVHP